MPNILPSFKYSHGKHFFSISSILFSFYIYIYIYILEGSHLHIRSLVRWQHLGLLDLSHDKCPCGRKPGLSHYAVCTTSFGWTRLPLFSFNFTLKVTFCNLSRPFPKNMALAVPTTPSQQPK